MSDFPHADIIDSRDLATLLDELEGEMGDDEDNLSPDQFNLLLILRDAQSEISEWDDGNTAYDYSLTEIDGQNYYHRS